MVDPRPTLDPSDRVSEVGVELADRLNEAHAAAVAVEGKADATHTHDYAATNHQHGVDGLTATGTKDATTFLRGDNTWATPPGDGSGGGGAPADHTHPVADLETTGTADSTTYLRGDGSWAGAPTPQDAGPTTKGVVGFGTSGDLRGPADAPTVPALADKVALAGTQTITGTKIFQASPQVPDPVGNADAVNKFTLEDAISQVISAGYAVVYIDTTGDDATTESLATALSSAPPEAELVAVAVAGS